MNPDQLDSFFVDIAYDIDRAAYKTYMQTYDAILKAVLLKEALQQAKYEEEKRQDLLKSAVQNSTPTNMVLKASIFDWNGKSGSIERSKLIEALGGKLYECIDVESDKTGRRMVFQDPDHGKGICYVSHDDPYLIIHVVDSSFPFKKKSDLYNKYFVLTGALSVTRDVITDAIENCGGTVQGSVSGVTDYLVAAPSVTNTAKAKAARAKGITVIDGEQLIQFLETH